MGAKKRSKREKAELKQKDKKRVENERFCILRDGVKFLKMNKIANS